MASAPSPRKREFMLNGLPGGYQSPIFSSGAGDYPAQDIDSCEIINLDSIFDNNTPRLLDNPVHDGCGCNYNSEEDFVSFQNDPDPFFEIPSDSISTVPEKIDVPNLPKGWVMDLVLNKAPRDITSTIDTGNIVSGTRRTTKHLSSSHAPSKGSSLESGNQ
ncbi:hypothetical protein O181_018989 [Austropuccinia psidii MF-1]|uniref:Uncharacterized protein n=1 Tax=Austropuccinia psidii MF-1 TaxID=1389203 RepID=A0A9Q3GUA4_9BASI|nr:hypothetical protein [Austropuccinia psidii MF-1]